MGKCIRAFMFDEVCIRTIVHKKEGPLFLARDVTDALGYKNSAEAYKTHCKSLIKLSYSILLQLNYDSPNPRGEIFIKESDVYRLTMRSNASNAERFQDWVCEEVIPSIRKTGRYLSGSEKAFSCHMQRVSLNSERIPYNYFSILNEMSQVLLLPLEQNGYSLPDHLVPDISEGRCFSDWLRKNRNVEPKNFPSYMHSYPDGRTVKARLYPIQFLSDFRLHFHDVWLPHHAMAYFKKRDPGAIAVIEAKVLPRLEVDRNLSLPSVYSH